MEDYFRRLFFMRNFVVDKKIDVEPEVCEVS
jgi:hypothetical protein